MTTMTSTTPTPTNVRVGNTGRSVTVRTRILAWTLLVVALSLCAIILITGRSLFAKIDADTRIELEHESTKFRAFANSPDPATGAGFISVQALLTSYLTHSLPEHNETFFSIVDGRADRRSTTEPLARLDTDAALVASFAGATQPSSGRIDTRAGPAVYAVLPVRMATDTAEGALVVVEFLAPEHDEAWFTVLIMSIAAVAALILAGLAGWVVAGRALTPIRKVQETAASIGEADLSRRIDVSGTDDVAQLALTFNHMLDRLESAFEGQRRFLDDAGHELRTPITIIRGHLDVMGSDPHERDQTLHLVDDELRRMSRMVDDLVLLARSERPDFLVPARTALAPLVIETLAKASAIAPRTWMIDAIPEGTALIDEQRLTQALLQLAANAVTSTEEADVIAIGGIFADSHLRLWVRDEGRGIADAEQQRIFERFARGTGARSGGGSGLGLAIVARIAQAHGGTVQVASALGAGSTFTITVPAHAMTEAVV